MRNEPSSEALTLRVLTDRGLIRAGARSTRYFTAQVVAPRAPRREVRAPLNVAFVLDRSGSMADVRKFELAREAVESALRMLDERDRFSLAVYDERVDVLAASTLATSSGRARALAALSEVGPRGSTDLAAGWLAGCEQIAERLDRESVTRCLLLTDGLANHGITDRGELAMHARELRMRGVVTSTFGVGADFDERLLRDMAHEGGGTFYFIEGASQIPELLTSELGEAAEVTVRDATVSISVPRGAEVEVLNRFRFTIDEQTRELTVQLEDLVSNQEVTVVTCVTFPSGVVGERTSIRVTAAGRDGSAAAVTRDVTWTYASHADNDDQPREREVDRAVAAVYAARARAEATEANRHGNLVEARRAIERTAARIRRYAGNDAGLGRIVVDLEGAVPEYSEVVMSASALKASFFVAENAQKSRLASGRAGRRST